MGQATHVVGVDIGGTTIKVAAATDQGEVLSDVRSLTQRGDGQAIVEGILDTIGQAIQQAGLKPTDIAALGFGAPGGIDRTEGLWSGSTTIRLGGWFPLTSLVKERYGIPATIDNDGNVAALGEMRFGAGSNMQDLVYLTLGSGVGGAIIIDGQVHYGKAGRRRAGEIGHMIVQKDGPRCGCGAHGCLEALSSATAVIREARAALQSGQPTLIQDLVENDPARLNGEVVGRAAQQGDEIALRIWRMVGEGLATGVYSLAMILAPQVVIIGGALAQAGDLVFKPMFEKLDYEASGRFNRAQVRMAALGERAGLIGSVTLALRMIGK